MRALLVLSGLFVGAAVHAQSLTGITLGNSTTSARFKAGPVKLRVSYRHRRRRAAAASVASPAAPTAQLVPVPSGPALDNPQVLALTKAGLGDPAILAKIRSQPAHYDTATDVLLALRRQGVSSEVIAAMIDAQASGAAADIQSDSPDSTAPHPPGLYLLAEWLPTPKLLSLRATASARTKTGSLLAYAFTGGIAPVAYRAVLPGAHAAITAGAARPSFFLFGNAIDPGVLGLVRLDAARSERRFRIGSFTIGGAHTGLRAGDLIPFSATPAGPQATQLRPDADLAPGEYGFVSTAPGAGLGGAEVATSTAVVFDFAVGPADQGSREGLRGAPSGIAPEPDSDATSLSSGVTTSLASGRSRKDGKVIVRKEPNSSASLYPGGK